MDRQQKEDLVNDIRDKFKKADATFVAEYSAIKAVEMNEFRKSLRDVSIDFKIVRNTLARRALKGTDVEHIAENFTGPTAIAFCFDDAAMGAKALVQFAKTQPNLKLRIGTLGPKAISPEEIKGLAELPSRDELLAKLAGSIQSPMSGFVRVLSGVPRNFLYALNAIKESKAAG